MAIYLISGKLGSGKTLSAVGRIREALLAGKPVATNLELYLPALLPPYAGDPARKKPVRCVRLPDHPSVDDLIALGSGNDTMDEERNGVIVLDELAAWLNARSFNDPKRMPVLDWLLHSRKHGWDVYFICQHLNQIDKQVRESLVEYLVVCRRTDRMRIPFVGGLISKLTMGLVKGQMPKVHIATVRYGTTPDAIIADRWIYQGKDLYGGYDTKQVFSPIYSRGTYSFLPPYHLCGGNVPVVVPAWKRVAGLVFAPPRLVERKPKHRLVELLAKLPPDKAVYHYKRLEALGAFGVAA